MEAEYHPCLPKTAVLTGIPASRDERTRSSVLFYFYLGFGILDAITVAEVLTMLHYAWVFLIIALVAAVLGFGGIAGTAAGIAKVLFFVFLVIWLVSFLMGRRTV